MKRALMLWKMATQKKSVLIFLVAGPVLFPACMHMMMGSDHQGMSDHSDIINEKEVEIGNFKVTATFSSMKINEETFVTLSIANTETGLTYHKADVMFSVLLNDSISAHAMMHGDHGTDSAVNTGESKEFHQELAESSDKGIFKFSYTPMRDGNYLLALTVTSVDGNRLGKPISLETNKHVMPLEKSGMTGMINTGSTIGVIAVAAMAAMMLLAVTR